MDRILVTGGAGYIGSHICKALARQGYLPVVYDNLSDGHRWAVKWGPLEEGDVADRARMMQVAQRHSVKAIMHFAAQAIVSISTADPLGTYQRNVVGTLQVASLASQMQLPVVFSSTCSLYGNTDAPTIDESQPLDPVNPYAASKSMAERILFDAPGVRSVALRYFNAAGADPDAQIGELHEPETHLVPKVLRVAAGEEPFVRIFGTDYPTPDGTCIRDYIHVVDLADAHLKALAHLMAGGISLALNLGSGLGHSVLEVIEACERVTGKRIEKQISERRAGDPPRLVANPALAFQCFGWRAAHSSLDEIVTDAWRWQKKLDLVRQW